MTTKATRDKQAMNLPTNIFQTENFPFEKKTGPGQIQTQGLCCSGHTPYLQAKLAGNALKFKLIMNKDTNDSIDSVTRSSPEKKS